MKLRVSWVALALTLLALMALDAKAAAQSGRGCHLRGSEEALRCHDISVPLDPQRKDAGQLKLHVAVAPAFRPVPNSDPVFVLAGGPGEAGSDVVVLLDSTFRRMRATRDIVFIDQRGTGLSGKLRCEGTQIDDANTDSQMNEAVVKCVAALKQPLAAYTTANAAADIEQVRLALGYGKVNIFGGSYGTRLGQHYARSYPDSVRTLILDGVAAPEQVIPAGGQDAQQALDGVFKRCAQDNACAKAYPQLQKEFETLLARVNSGAVKLDFAHPRTMKRVQLPLTNLRFVSVIHATLYSPQDGNRLPYIIHNAYEGNWGPFLARSYVASDYSPEGLLSMPLYLAVVCGEDMPRLTDEARAADEKGSFLRGYAGRIAAVCPLLKVPPVPAQAVTPIAAPTLLLSGAQDPVTPPRRAESAAKAMSKARMIVVANAGHGVSRLGCMPRLMREFLDKPEQAPDQACLREIAAMPFQLGHAGANP
ncbi:alpha/beta hydrolase [Pseudoduganella violaceinigra]|uniref:alpha/beta hydrolase n=1 Tax=Pseudoduganella violaceinigra TaxID=246602 RepID=UPI000415E009|nr:alpha/beta hydrolase [Pseudoduganella violaceinigra]